MAKSEKSERSMHVGYVDRVPALGGRTKATLVIRLDKLGRLANRANQNKNGRAKMAHGAIEIRLDSPHPMAGEGTLAPATWVYLT